MFELDPSEGTMFFFLAKEEGIWEPSTASTRDTE